ncbi:MAG: phosphoglucosamine mutase [Clostridiales bacterium]|nr:phosphoglucosamine mutase [Clostridiales bacterium]
MGIFFGTDGLRGKIGDELTDDIAYRCGNALAKLYPNSHLLICKDTRTSGDCIAISFASGVISAGGNITYIGICTTPGLAYLTHTLGYDYGISITASHNPANYNGIKIFDKNYKKLTDKKEETLEKNFFSNIIVPNEHLGKITFKPELLKHYTDFLSQHSTNLSNITIVLDCANGATSNIAPLIFENAGAKTITINNDTSGININNNCGATDTRLLQKTVIEKNADIGFAFDGDGDRVIAVDRSGNILDGDQIIYILTCHLLNTSSLHKKMVVGTRHTNMGMELALREKGIELIRTDIGDKFVSSKLSEYGLQLGGEQSGHIIQKEILPTGDGILTALSLSNIIAKENKSLLEYASYSPYHQCNINVTVNNKLHIINSEELDKTISRYTNSIKDSGRIMVRLSGTEPVIRIMVEGKEKGRCTTIAKNIERTIIKIDKEQNICAE